MVSDPSNSSTSTYDIIVFGDEVPGVLALVCAAREYRRQKQQFPKSLLMFKSNAQLGIGGHLVRGGLSYLDRTSINRSIRESFDLGIFGDPPAIYAEFLKKAKVVTIALDPREADLALQGMLREIGADILDNIEIESVIKNGQEISAILLSDGKTYQAKQFIDCTVNAELAQAALVEKLKGFETFGLPNSELAVTLVFETQGLSVERLRNVELQYLRRFTNSADAEAQNWLNIAAGNNPETANQLRRELGNEQNREQKRMFVDKDHIDVRCKALSIAYQSFRGLPLLLEQSRTILDNGNVAILPGGRLSWNALLFFVSADEAENLARGKAKPTQKMLDEMSFVSRWFQSNGASTVKPASELYIRHAGNITGAVEPLTGAKMLAGGVPQNEALGTFSYHFDVRGGIAGLGLKASNKGLEKFQFEKPVFNIGIRHALVKDVPNLAVVSPGSGFEGYACCAGRIVEFNCGVGQGVGIAAAIALVNDRNLADISNKEVRTILENTRRLSRIYGTPNLAVAKELQEFERIIIA